MNSKYEPRGEADFRQTKRQGGGEGEREKLMLGHSKSTSSILERGSKEEREQKGEGHPNPSSDREKRREENGSTGIEEVREGVIRVGRTLTKAAVGLGPFENGLELKKAEKPMDLTQKPSSGVQTRTDELRPNSNMEVETSQLGKDPSVDKENNESSIKFSHIQEAISLAMKEAMAIQLKDWFQVGKGVDRLIEKLENKEETMVEETALEESGSRESHCPSKKETEQEPGKSTNEEKETEVGSFTMVAVEACEQLSRERKEKGEMENKQETEVVSPVTTRAG